MKPPIWHITLRMLAVLFLLVAAGNASAQEDDWLNQMVHITESKGTRYQLLRHISAQTGYLFAYDGHTLNNDAEVEIKQGNYTLRDAIYIVTDNPRLHIRLIGNNHILLQLPEKKEPLTSVPAQVPAERFFAISGTVYDLFSKEPVTSATVGISGASMGTITNRDGRFRIVVPDTLRHRAIRISHVGYEGNEIQIMPDVEQPLLVMLEPKVVSLQEVVVRVINPAYVMQRMLNERVRNYSQSPVRLTTFYREGVSYKKQNVDFTEAVLDVYKQPYRADTYADQVKLIKKRRVVKSQERDTVVTKVKSGIYSVLLLDILKNEPDFLDRSGFNHPFVYTHTDIAVVDDRLANVISFRQRKGIKESLYRGELLIDTENYALLEARFELHPDYIEKATPQFIEKKSKHVKLALRSAKYVVSYKPVADGGYHISHVRGDLEFRVRRKKQWFSSTLNIWLELATCKVDTENVQPIPRGERLSPRSVFAETKHPYDADFWGNANVILPEDEFKELIINNLMEVSGAE